MTKSGKHCGKRRNCAFCAISSFVTMFSKSRLLQRRPKASIWGKGLIGFECSFVSIDNFFYRLPCRMTQKDHFYVVCAYVHLLVRNHTFTFFMCIVFAGHSMCFLCHLLILFFSLLSFQVCFKEFFVFCNGSTLVKYGCYDCFGR